MIIKERVGITTTLPVEAVFAAGKMPVDLNNLFIASESSFQSVAEAEKKGFPQNACAWVKGLYSAVAHEGIKSVVGVSEGDCSQNDALLDIWLSEGLEVHHFSYPRNRELASITHELELLAKFLGTDINEAESWKVRLDKIRAIAREIDFAAYKDYTVSSRELFESLLSLTDFYGEPDRCLQELLSLKSSLAGRKKDSEKIPLGVLGVPTILSDLWEVIDDIGGRVIYHEVPAQFGMLNNIGKGLAESYLNFTYPYNVAFRIDEIKKQIAERKIKGIIHYAQSFCHRQIHDMLFRRELGLPILTIEADRPLAVDGRTITRIEAFLEQLSD